MMLCLSKYIFLLSFFKFYLFSTVKGFLKWSFSLRKMIFLPGLAADLVSLFMNALASMTILDSYFWHVDPKSSIIAFLVNFSILNLFFCRKRLISDSCYMIILFFCSISCFINPNSSSKSFVTSLSSFTYSFLLDYFFRSRQNYLNLRFCLFLGRVFASDYIF